MWEESFVQILQTVFLRLKQKNPRYSRRAYARKIGISSGTLSDLLKSKTRVTKDRASQILERIEITSQERTRMQVLFGNAYKISKPVPETNEFLALHEWSFRAILFAFDLDKYDVNAEFISQRMDLPLKDVEAKISFLLKLKLLDRDQNGKIHRAKELWRIPDNSAREFAHKMYKSNMTAIGNAITAIPAAQRDFTTMSFAGNSSKLKLVRKEIREFHERLLAIMEESPTDEVYELSMFLHPTLTKGLT